MSNIRLVDKGWLMWCYYGDTIEIDNVFKWIENFIITSITHETIHLVLWKLEGMDTSNGFDKIFGLRDPTILLCPEEDTRFDGVFRGRELDFWTKHGHRVNETKIRSTLKSLTGRALEISIGSFLMVLAFTADFPLSVGVAIANETICAFISYFNDRGWNRIQWGRRVTDVEEDGK